MRPEIRPGEYVLVATDDVAGAEAFVREDEGPSAVLSREAADARGLAWGEEAVALLSAMSGNAPQSG